MDTNSLSLDIRPLLLKAQRNEITEHFIYSRLADQTKNVPNREVLKRIADDEMRHYHLWKSHTKEEVAPNKWRIWKYFWISRIFGLTFGLKLMEKGEEKAQINYGLFGHEIPEAIVVAQEESRHENDLIGLIQEEHLKYLGSIVLGLNDALIEILGTMAGLTFALQNTKLVALAGTITGIAGALSMSSSEYLSNKTEGKHSQALKSALFTGVAYIIAVVFLIIPYLFIRSPYIALVTAVLCSLLIVFLFTYYLSVTNEQPFRKRFSEMAVLTTVVALISFLLGYVARIIFGIDV